MLKNTIQWYLEVYSQQPKQTKNITFFFSGN